MRQRLRNTMYGREALTDSTEDLVVGSTKLYEANGQMRHVPMPTPDPKGIYYCLLNLPVERLDGKNVNTNDDSPISQILSTYRNGENG